MPQPIIRRRWWRPANSKFFLVYIKVEDIRFPIIIPFPLIILEELLTGLMIVTWLGKGFLRPGAVNFLAGAKGWGGRHKAAGRGNRPYGWSGLNGVNMLNYVDLWQWPAAARQAIRTLRRQGSYDLVHVKSDEAVVRISLI
ncbi:MAG TPA: hypothetical protein GXX29_05825 [Firmicutes bacterium]|nr:hypothetical protein [Bacillota bacterium]